MVRLIARRLALMVPTLAGVTVLLCALAHYTPGGPGAAGEHSSVEIAALTEQHAARFGLDEPFHTRYAMWMSRVLGAGGGDVLPLGESAMTGRPVREELKSRLSTTLALDALALTLALGVAVPAGVVMAWRAGGRFDRAIFSILLTLWSVPMVVMATLLLGYATTGGLGVEWFPSSGPARDASSLDRLWHLTPPALCLAIVACAPLARHVRAAVLEQLGAAHVQVALAKGLSRAMVMRRHVLRAGLASLATVLALLAPRLIAGSVLVETVFSIDGMGMLAWRSAVNRDLDVVLAIALITAMLHMLSLLLADVLVMMLDPRVRLAGDSTGATRP